MWLRINSKVRTVFDCGGDKKFLITDWFFNSSQFPQKLVRKRNMPVSVTLCSNLTLSQFLPFYLLSFPPWQPVEPTQSHPVSLYPTWDATDSVQETLPVFKLKSCLLILFHLPHKKNTLLLFCFSGNNRLSSYGYQQQSSHPLFIFVNKQETVQKIWNYL